MYFLCILYVMYRWLVILFLLLILTRFYDNSNQNGNENFEKKNYEHTQGLTILSIVNSFCTNLKNNLSKEWKMFHKIVNALTKFSDFLEHCYYFDRKEYIFCLCKPVPDSLSRSLIFSIFTISLCIFFTGLEFGKKKRLFWWKKSSYQNNIAWKQRHLASKKNKFERNLKTWKW